MAGYAKLWSSILQSTIWQEPDPIRIIWVKGGFGLIGMSGTGKTCAIAAMLRLQLTNNYRLKAPISPDGWYSWVDISWYSWPTLAQRWRMDPLGLTEEMITTQRRMTSARLLILDDLGRESRKDFETDRVTSILDAVVTARDRNEMPTIWTSNLDFEALATFYGLSFTRRLFKLNPATPLTDARLI